MNSNSRRDFNKKVTLSTAVISSVVGIQACSSNDREDNDLYSLLGESEDQTRNPQPV